MYKDNEYQFVAVFDKQAETWEKSNALGHMSIGFTHTTFSQPDNLFCEYRNNDTSAKISRFPFITLEGSSKKLTDFYDFIVHNDLPYNLFSRHMFGQSAEQQMASFANSDDKKIIGIITFAESTVLKGATKSFSLLK